MAETKKKMGGMRLGSFSGIKTDALIQELEEREETQESPEMVATLAEPEKPLEIEVGEEVEASKEVKVEPVVEAEPPKTTTPEKVKTSGKKKLAPVNIKLEERQRVALDEKARIIRSNNLEAVPAKDRVYPQHLIAVAIDLLLESGIDWSEVKNIKELRKGLNLGE